MDSEGHLETENGPIQQERAHGEEWNKKEHLPL
jgi:hypothetical protein